ncbi:MAG: DEAD/DEAH box helicase [Egibacteraceae bacterium]
MSTDLISAFADGYSFALDDFQLRGISALADHRSTLVAAPTGAGKTVVGEYAVFQALRQGGKCFYTTPIKALSNQKYADLCARYGSDQVGLLTGDNSVNGEAGVVVMTTEVLRNMLYEASSTLVGLHAVVLDEVHYLADRSRGAVWEEVIIQLPPSVQLACLSATVSNAEEFGAWLTQVRAVSAEDERAACDVVITERRPVPLDHHYAVNDRLYPTFRTGARVAGDSSNQAKARERQAQRARSGAPNPEVLMLERRSGPSNRYSRRGRPQQTGVRLRPPRRSELVRELRRRKWLPAIVFVFSRAGCDAAVGQLLDDGVRLTTPHEQAAIRAVIDERVAGLDPEDLDVLGYGRWATGLEHGIAAHHAGMVPTFKETVEQLFVRGLVKVCFATETLALGINMPARTVVIERLEKWDGQQHTLLTPGQFTQLTGRAGRRGLDTVGHAIVSYQRDIDFPTVASLVGRRTEPLRSIFAPSYNMAVNLLRRHDRAEAVRLLARSFAQFQIDGGVATDEERIRTNREALAGYEQNLHSERGDFTEYWALRKGLSRRESEAARERRERSSGAVIQALAGLSEGDVVALPRGGRRPDLAAIVGTNMTRDGTPLVSAVTEDRRLVRMGPREFTTPPRTVGWVRLPHAGGPRQSAYRKTVAGALRQVEVEDVGRQRHRVEVDHEARGEVERLRQALQSHPVHTDPELETIQTWARRHEELLAGTERLERQVRRRTGLLVRQLDRIVGVLSDLGYLSDERPTATGLQLAGLYAETDLVLAECLRRGELEDLDAASLAAVASMFVYTTRLKDPPEPVPPTGAIARAVDAVFEVWDGVVRREETAGLPLTRAPDAGFVETTWRWAQGEELDEALGESGMTAGDFVRTTKQVADLLRQIAAVTDRPLAASAQRASRSLVRGVVAYTGLE